MLPPLTTRTEFISSRLSKLNTGDMKAWGLSVLSEEYSYPISTILTFLILPIDDENGVIFALLPPSLLTETNFGSFL